MDNALEGQLLRYTHMRSAPIPHPIPPTLSPPIRRPEPRPTPSPGISNIYAAGLPAAQVRIWPPKSRTSM